MITSITKQGRFEPFGLQVAEGQIPYHYAITVFGYNADVDTSEETVWPNAGEHPHPAVGSSNNNSVSSMFNLILVEN